MCYDKYSQAPAPQPTRKGKKKDSEQNNHEGAVVLMADKNRLQLLVDVLRTLKTNLVECEAVLCKSIFELFIPCGILESGAFRTFLLTLQFLSKLKLSRSYVLRTVVLCLILSASQYAFYPKTASWELPLLSDSLAAALEQMSLDAKSESAVRLKLMDSHIGEIKELKKLLKDKLKLINKSI